jgi:hypothetical protein
MNDLTLHKTCKVSNSLDFNKELTLETLSLFSLRNYKNRNKIIDRIIMEGKYEMC